MDEAIRQEALQAMGVPVLTPRFLLSGAKSSHVLVENEPVNVELNVAENSDSLNPSPATQAESAEPNTFSSPEAETSSDTAITPSSQALSSHEVQGYSRLISSAICSPVQKLTLLKS